MNLIFKTHSCTNDPENIMKEFISRGSISSALAKNCHKKFSVKPCDGLTDKTVVNQKKIHISPLSLKLGSDEEEDKENFLFEIDIGTRRDYLSFEGNDRNEKNEEKRNFFVDNFDSCSKENFDSCSKENFDENIENNYSTFNIKISFDSEKIPISKRSYQRNLNNNNYSKNFQNKKYLKKPKKSKIQIDDCPKIKKLGFDMKKIQREKDLNDELLCMSKNVLQMMKNVKHDISALKNQTQISRNSQFKFNQFRNIY